MQFDDKTKMIKTEKDGYFHEGECYQKYLDHKEFTKKENEEWDELYQYIKKLHNVVVVPPANVVRLQALRNGNDLKKGKPYKRYKMGAEYSLMLEAYLLAEDEIKKSIATKLKDSNDVSAINYCISIMTNKLNQAWKNRQKAKEAKEENKKLERKIEEMSDVVKKMREVQQNLISVSKNNDENEIDITTLLD